MKNKLKNYAFGVLCLGILASCNKSNEQVSPEEGYKSTTDKSESFDWANEENFETPLFHMHFSSDVSEEERKRLYDEGFNAFKLENKELFSNNTSRGKATEWFFKVFTVTGTQKHNETGGNVAGKITYKTDIGTYSTSWKTLDNPGNDREQGSVDVYLIRGSISGQAVKWVKLRKVQFALQGTDGWFPTSSMVWANPELQTTAASGETNMWFSINELLDSPTSSEWDYWSTGTDYTTGTIRF